MAGQTDPTASFDDFQAKRVEGIPAGRSATAHEVANAVLFLASDLSSFTTAAAVSVDGGANEI